MERRLEPDDFLYRVIDPEHTDDEGPQAVAFEDPGKPYESLSFYVARIATPKLALSALAKYKRARDVCHKRHPSPTDMYRNGYRVAKLPAKLVLDAIEQTKGSKRPLSIVRCQEGDYDNAGHLNLHNGKFHSQALAAQENGLVVLSEEETLEGFASE